MFRPSSKAKSHATQWPLALLLFVLTQLAPGQDTNLPTLWLIGDWRDGRVLRANPGHAQWAAEPAQAGGAHFIDLNELVSRRYEELGQAKVTEDFFVSEHTHTSKAGAQLNGEIIAIAVRQLRDCEFKRFLMAASPPPDPQWVERWEASVQVHWIQADVLAPPPLEAFDLIFDRGCYHGVRRRNAAGYVETVQKLCRPGGRVLILAGNANERGPASGPPRVDETELVNDFSAAFDFERLQEIRFDTADPNRPGALAWSVLLRRKPVSNAVSADRQQ